MSRNQARAVPPEESSAFGAVSRVNTSPPGFPLFPNLPVELRIQIWQNALPDNIGPALYMYKRGCWRHRLLTESEYGYTPTGDENDNWVLEFCYALLGDSQLNITLLFVNSEARDVALAWAAKQAPDTRIVEKDSLMMLVRPFKPESDAIYVTVDDWDTFLGEESELPYDLGWDRIDRIYGSHCAVTRLAVPEALFRQKEDHWRCLTDLFISWSCVETLYIVADPQPEMLASTGDESVLLRCEIDEVQGPGLLWKSDEEEWLAQDDNGTHAFDQILQMAAEELRRELIGLERNFRVRVVRSAKSQY